MSELSIITAVAICVCGAFITGSVAFVIKSLMNDIKQAETTAEKGMEFVRSEISGIRKSLDSFKSEERHKDDEIKVAIDNTKQELRSESRADRTYVDQTKQELKDEMHYYWSKAENVLEARRQDVYMIHKKIDELKDEFCRQPRKVVE
jgi:predicted RND superfamily exporter protein